MGMLSCVWFFCDTWTQLARLLCLFLRQEYWNGLLFPPPGDLPNPGIKPASPSLAGKASLPWSHQGSPVLEESQLIM